MKCKDPRIRNLGLATKFWIKCSFRGIPRFSEESVPKLGTERNYMKKKKLPVVLLLILLQQTELRACFLLQNSSKRNSESLLQILFHGTEFQVVFFSPEWFRTEFREFSATRNSQNSAGTNLLFRLFRLPRNSFFFLKIAAAALPRRQADRAGPSEDPPQQQTLRVATFLRYSFVFYSSILEKVFTS